MESIKNRTRYEDYKIYGSNFRDLRLISFDMTLRDRNGGIPWITSLESLGITRPDQIVIRIRP